MNFLLLLCQVLIFVFAQAAITKHHTWCGFNNRNFCPTVLEAEKSKIKMPANLVPG